jgi:hypothetical protein
MHLPRCITYAECETHDGERVEVIRTYRVWAPRPGWSADDPRSRQVRLRAMPHSQPRKRDVSRSYPRLCHAATNASRATSSASTRSRVPDKLTAHTSP